MIRENGVFRTLYGTFPKHWITYDLLDRWDFLREGFDKKYLKYVPSIRKMNNNKHLVKLVRAYMKHFK